MSRVPGLALLWVLGPAPVLAQSLAYEGSLGVSSGRYLFAERTTSFGLSTGLAVTTGGLTLRASLPVWFQNSTVISASPVGLPGTGVPSGPGSGGAPTGGSSSGRVGDSGRKRPMGGGGGGSGSQSALARSRVDVPSSSFTDYQIALGDPLASMSLALFRGGRASLTVTGLAKVPVTDTSGFGTGEWDLGLALGSSIRLGPGTLIGVDAGWWYLGDMPGLDFRNPVSGTLSLNHLIGHGWGAMLFASGTSSSLPGFDAPVMVGGGFLRPRAGGSWGIQGGVGLTETSPDVSLALFWRVGM